MHISHHSKMAFLFMLPVVLAVTVFFGARYTTAPMSEYEVTPPNNPELSSLTVPYYTISDMSGVGPYSSNQEVAGYMHNGIDFMADHDLVEYRSLSDGVVAEAKVFYDSTRSDTHPQVNVIVLYNKTTKILYSFEPYTKNIADAERQLTLLNIKEGDTIVAGQSLGKLIKTAPQSHVHIHVMKNGKEFCFAPLFTTNDIADMLTKTLNPLHKEKKLCYE